MNGLFTYLEFLFLKKNISNKSLEVNLSNSPQQKKQWIAYGRFSQEVSLLLEVWKNI